MIPLDHTLRRRLILARRRRRFVVTCVSVVGCILFLWLLRSYLMTTTSSLGTRTSTATTTTSPPADRASEGFRRASLTPKATDAILPARKHKMAVVMMTSTNGSPRSREIQLVLRALCSGNNLLGLARDDAQVYVSVDAVDPARGRELLASLPRIVGEDALCKNIEGLVHVSSTEPGFPSSATGRIAAHYDFAMRTLFLKHEYVVFLEDDLEPSRDFWDFFSPSGNPESFRALRDWRTSRVWCLSSWNDLGLRTHQGDEAAVFRTDFFPGLGWMTSSDVYKSSAMGTSWPSNPTTGWDNWLRSNNVEDLDCLVPRVNRVRHISTSGTNVHDPSLATYGAFAFASRPSGDSWAFDPPGSALVPPFEHGDVIRAMTTSGTRVHWFDPDRPFAAPPAADVVLLYRRAQLTRVFAHVGLRPAMLEPRGGWAGVTKIPLSGSSFFIYIVDVASASAELLAAAPPAPAPQELPTLRADGLRSVLALPGESCTDACPRLVSGGKCRGVDLERLANQPGHACRVMKDVAPCENGCGHQVGVELPAYVSDPARDTHGQCLVGVSERPICEASHKSTSRICVCATPRTV